MKRRPVLNLPEGLSVLGLGCWSFGGGDYWGERDQRDTDALVARALELGINFYDTAESYNGGASERALGVALAGQRPEILIGSKVSPDNAERGRLRQSLEASLERLGTDYLDLYMLHWPLTSQRPHVDPDSEELEGLLRLEDVVEAFERARTDGLIRSWGVSNFGIRQLRRLAELGVTPAVNQLAWSLVSRGAEREILPHCAEHGIGVLGYMSLMQGLFSDRIASISELAPQRRRTRHYASEAYGGHGRHGGPGCEAQLETLREAMRGIAADYGINMAQLAVAWSVQDPRLSSTLVGASRPEQLEATVAAAAVELSAETMAELARLSDPVLEAIGENIDYFRGEEARNSD